MNHSVCPLAGFSLCVLLLSAGCQPDTAPVRHAGRFAVHGFPNGTEIPTTFTIDTSSKTQSFSKTIRYKNSDRQNEKYKFDSDFTGTDGNGFDCYQLSWAIGRENSDMQSGTVQIKFDGRKSEVLTLFKDIRVHIAPPDA